MARPSTRTSRSRKTRVDHYDADAKLGGELKEALNETGLGDHPALVKFFLHLSKRLGEEGVLTGKAFGDSALKSPVEAQQQINALRQDANFMKAYMNQNRRDPAHIEAVDKMGALHELAYPSGQAA